MSDEMENEFMKRGFLLPQGCKDLSDVLNLKTQNSGPAPLPPITGEMTVPSWMTVGELAKALNKKPFQIISDLMVLGVFANIKDQVDFESISRVLRKYGISAKKAI